MLQFVSFFSLFLRHLIDRLLDSVFLLTHHSCFRCFLLACHISSFSVFLPHSTKYIVASLQRERRERALQERKGQRERAQAHRQVRLYRYFAQPVVCSFFVHLVAVVSRSLTISHSLSQSVCCFCFELVVVVSNFLTVCDSLTQSFPLFACIV